MSEFPIACRQLAGWYELACRCGQFSVTVGHVTRAMPPAEVAASIALIIGHARDCKPGRAATDAARLETERLRPVPPSHREGSSR